jgi:hypothetical protein
MCAIVGARDDSPDDSTGFTVIEGNPQADAARSPPSNHDIEAALAEALVLASRAGQWSVVDRLAGELQARRLQHWSCQERRA